MSGAGRRREREARVRGSVVQALRESLAAHEIKGRVEASPGSRKITVHLEMPAGARLAGQLASALTVSGAFEPRLSAAGEGLVRSFHDARLGGVVDWLKDEDGRSRGLVIRLDAPQAEALVRRLEELTPRGRCFRQLFRWLLRPCRWRRSPRNQS